MIKLCRRIELSQSCYDTVYRQGKLNVISDALSRVHFAAKTVNAQFYTVHCINHVISLYNFSCA